MNFREHLIKGGGSAWAALSRAKALGVPDEELEDCTQYKYSGDIVEKACSKPVEESKPVQGTTAILGTGKAPTPRTISWEGGVPKGWVCPVCGRGNAPATSFCGCVNTCVYPTTPAIDPEIYFRCQPMHIGGPPSMPFTTGGNFPPGTIMG